MTNPDNNDNAGWTEVADIGTEKRSLVIDGLNCAVVTREQFERTLKGGVSIINLTPITPWSSLPDSLKELETNLAPIEAMSDIACIVRTVDDIQAARSGREIRRHRRLAEFADGGSRPCDACHLQAPWHADFQPTYNEHNGSAKARRSLATPTKE